MSQSSLFCCGLIFFKIACAMRKILFPQNPPHSCQPIRIGRCRPIRVRLALHQSHRCFQSAAAANQLPVCPNQSPSTFRCRKQVAAASQSSNERRPWLLDADWLRPRIAASDWLPAELDAHWLRALAAPTNQTRAPCSLCDSPASQSPCAPRRPTTCNLPACHRLGSLPNPRNAAFCRNAAF